MKSDEARIALSLIIVWMVVALFMVMTGCSAVITARDPRVVQCDKCGEVDGVIGGLLPGQGSRCGCGGRVHKVRDLSAEDWRRAAKRGYVTLQDGTPVGEVLR